MTVSGTWVGVTLSMNIVATIQAAPAQSTRPKGTSSHSTATSAAVSGSAQAYRLDFSGPMRFTAPR